MKLSENHLTAEQEKLWEKTLKELTALYQELHLTAKPMPEEKIKAIRIPSNIAEEGSMPLPWDVQLLLRFDKNLTLAPEDNEFPLLADAASGVLCSADVLIELLSDLSNEEPNLRRGRKVFLEQAGDLPPLIDLPQLGGDELPVLWPVLPRSQCTIVLHLDTDNTAEFYVRSTSLFNYVLQYLASANNLPHTIEDTKTDVSQLWAEKKDSLILDQIESKMELLNDALFNTVKAMFHHKDSLYDADDDDTFGDDEDEDAYYSGDDEFEDDEYEDDYDDEDVYDYDDEEDYSDDFDEDM